MSSSSSSSSYVFFVAALGNELFEDPELFKKNVEKSKRGAVIRGVYYDRLDGVPPSFAGNDTLKNICFTNVFNFIKQTRREQFDQRLRSLQFRDSEEEEEVEATNRSISALHQSLDALPLELKETIEDYCKVIEKSERVRYEKQTKRLRERAFRLGGKIYVKNLAGKMIEIDGVEPSMTIFNVKQLLDQRTGIVPQSVQLFYHQALDDKKTISHYNIREGSVLYIVLAWGGG